VNLAPERKLLAGLSDAVSALTTISTLNLTHPTIEHSAGRRCYRQGRPAGARTSWESLPEFWRGLMAGLSDAINALTTICRPRSPPGVRLASRRRLRPIDSASAGRPAHLVRAHHRVAARVEPAAPGVLAGRQAALGGGVSCDLDRRAARAAAVQAQPAVVLRHLRRARAGAAVAAAPCRFPSACAAQRTGRDASAASQRLALPTV